MVMKKKHPKTLAATKNMSLKEKVAYHKVKTEKEKARVKKSIAKQVGDTMKGPGVKIKKSAK